MCKIELTKGCYALIDCEDLPLLNKNSWCVSSNGYAKRGTKSKGKTTIHYMHRVVTRAKKGEYVDHINGNRLDNRKSNLRVCDQSVNGLNRTSLNSNNTTGFAGVWFDKRRNKYSAEVMVNRKKRHIGRYFTPEEASEARKAYKTTHGII